jgi:hypothetical protein
MRFSTQAALLFLPLVADHVVSARITTGRRTKSESSKREKNCKPTKKAKLPKTCALVDTDTSILKPAFPQFMDPTDLKFQQDAMRCGVALLNSGFALYDIPNYSKWYEDDSVLHLPEVGQYVGIEAIAEYVGFIFSPYASVIYNPTPELNQDIPISADGNECTFLSMGVQSTHTNPAITGEDTVSIDTVVAIRSTFTITDPSTVNPQTIKMNKTDVYYPKPFLVVFFEALYTNGVARFVCEIMKNNCNSVFATDNCYNSVDQCVEEMLSLPSSEEGNGDGKSFGCRLIHASFAAMNMSHCPHISFVPKYDESCYLKCQESKGHSSQDFFHPQELAMFENYSESVGLGVNQFVSPTMFPLSV